MDGAGLVGYARLIGEGARAHVRQVVVARSHRRRGIASQLVAAAVDEARRRGFASVYLSARPNAVRMYERLGFRVVGSTFRMGRTYLPHVRMELPLR